MKILAICGSYRKGGIIDAAVEEVLASARECGAVTEKIYLIDNHIEFCTNCRICTQENGIGPGACIQRDDMQSILKKIKQSDAIILGSPVNFGTVTAIMKRFMERLICLVYWPWGINAPQIRNPEKYKKAVVIASSAAPGLLTRFSSDIVKLLKKAADLLGAKTVGVLIIGCAAGEKKQDIGNQARKRACILGKKLVQSK